MRDLLRIIAEPLIAERDKKLRKLLRELVGKSLMRRKAVALMNGSRNQAAICKESGIDQGMLSRLVKALKGQALITTDEKQPKLTLAIPDNFFEDSEDGVINE